MNLDKNTILLVGGGSGGHVIPVFEVYKYLKNKDQNLRVIVVGSGSKVEQKTFSGIATYRKIKTGKIHRYFSIKNLVEPFLSFCGLVQSFGIILKYRPSVIFSKGGYVSVPIIFFAKIFKIPYSVHESDLEPGMANRFAFKHAKKIFLGFPLQNYKNISNDKAVFSGQILRPSLILREKKSELEDFGFKAKKPVIFVTGGSQGSANINKVILESLSSLLHSYNLIHQSGILGLAQAEKARTDLAESETNSYYVTDHLGKVGKKDLMEEAIDLADVVIARAGATTVAELAAKKKPMILVPYKYASGDHQTKNSKILEKAGGAVVIPDDDLRPEVLVKRIDLLFLDTKKMENMGENAYNLFPQNGLEIICNSIIKRYEEV